MPDPRQSFVSPSPQGDAPQAFAPLRRREPIAVEGGAAVPPEQAALVMRLSQEVAALRAALDLSRHRIATLEVEASVDPVSGLLNRRAFEREIEKAASFRSRYQTPALAVLIAIDGLAAVAERHGQSIANRVVQTLGARMKATMRSCDVAARIDPYLFGLVLWNVADADGQPRLDALRAAVGGMDKLLEGRVAAVNARVAAAPIAVDDNAANLLPRIEERLGPRRRGPRSITR